MTRETKIGLLVGLGFIIVIGVLLSDHIQTATEPPQARLAMVGQNVRSAVNSPGTAGPQAAPVTAPDTVAPSGTVMTREDLAERPAPVKIIKIAPAGSDVAAAPTNVVAGANDLVVSRTPDVSPLAASTGVELQPVSTGNLNDARPVSALAGGVDSSLFTNKGGDARALDAAIPAKAVDRKYVAVANDTLSKICRKFFGSNDKKYMDLVVAANKDLKGDRGHIVIGHAYTIPAKPVEATAAEVAGIAPTTQPASSVVIITTDKPVTQKPTAVAAAATGTRWYTVKDNDNLWKIATQQLGSGSAKNIAAIQELNRDVIKGNTVRANTKIKLPAKQVATTE